MKVARVGEVVEVEILPGCFRNRARISKNVAPRGMVQNHSESGRGRTWNAAHERHIDSAVLQSVERDLSQGVVADAGLKPDAAAECGEVVRDNRRGRAEGEHHAVGEQFAFGRELLRETVKYEVEV